jgi:stage IV sporulation protein FB
MNLSFRLGRIPVRIQPSFLVITLLLNFGLARTDPTQFVVWTAIVLGSVLVHELGHALVGVAYGLRPRIDLHGFGGTTSWARDAHGSSPLTPLQGIAISLAGPGMGFAAGALVGALASVVGPGPRFAVQALGASFGLAPPLGDLSLGNFAYQELLFVNVGWGILNLLPMLPLDGGSVMVHAFALSGRGERPARVVSLAVAVLATGAAAITGRIWPAILAFSFIGSNVRALREIRDREHDQPMVGELEQARAALGTNDTERALAIARPVALRAKTAPLRAEALQVVAFAFLRGGHVADADAAIAAMPRGYQPAPAFLEMRGRLGGQTPT